MEVFQGVADLWQGHRDLTRQLTHYLTSRARFHQQLCFVLKSHLVKAQLQVNMYIHHLTLATK